MEREFKWDAFGALQDAVLMWALDRDADSAKMTEMDARYFDTAEGALSAEKTALRLRRGIRKHRHYIIRTGRDSSPARLFFRLIPFSPQKRLTPASLRPQPA